MSQERKKRNSTSMKEMAPERYQSVLDNKFKKEIEDCIRSLAHRVLDEVHSLEQNSHTNYSCSNNNEESKRHALKKDGVLADKVFMARSSLFTELFEMAHIRTIYHIFIVILILLFLNTMLYDLVDSGSLNLGLRLVVVGFGRLDLVALVWIGMQVAALIPGILLPRWAHARPALVSSPMLLRLWDSIWLVALLLFQTYFILLPIRLQVAYDVPIASSFIILVEMVRFVMKIHAYVRSTCPRALQAGAQHAVLPPFSCYIYFLFAPTLVYRDAYPRTARIRWDVVSMRLLEMGATIVYISFLCERFLLTNWANFGKTDEVLEAEKLVLFVFSSMLPALLTFMCGFYLLLHCWLNATAELLTFADRRFYMDWWNQSGYGGFYRTWNTVVHDWLYAYIYKDVVLLTSNRFLGTVMVFLVSAVVHEIILMYAFGFFYPVLLILFGFFGFIFIFLTRQKTKAIGNIFLWWSLAVGTGIIWSLYSMEYFARANCPKPDGISFWESLMPRSWTCHHIVFKPNWKFQNPFHK